jgi:hypothetical protein
MQILHRLRCRCLTLGVGMLASMPLKTTSPVEIRSVEKAGAARCALASTGDLNIWTPLWPN